MDFPWGSTMLLSDALKRRGGTTTERRITPGELMISFSRVTGAGFASRCEVGTAEGLRRPRGHCCAGMALLQRKIRRAAASAVATAGVVAPEGVRGQKQKIWKRLWSCPRGPLC